MIEALERLMSNRTTFMIAHRLSTLDGCDIRIELTGNSLKSEVESSAVEQFYSRPLGHL